MNKKTIVVKTKNKRERDVLYAAAVAAGTPLLNSAVNQTERHRWERYPNLTLIDGELSVCTENHLGQTVTPEEFIALLLKQKSVVLNRDFTATRDGDSIVVGCQKFPVSAVKEVYETLCK